MHNKRKWEETGVNVCDRSVANGLNRKGFTHRETKGKPPLTP